jgi:hypothetical protein
MIEDREMQRIQQARRFARIASDYIDINIILIGVALIALFLIMIGDQLLDALPFYESDVIVLGATLLCTIAGLLSLKAVFYRRKHLHPDWSDNSYALSFKYSLSALMMVTAGLLVLVIAVVL